MGKYVAVVGDPPFEFGNEKYTGLNDTAKDLVEAKFNTTMATAEDMLERLVGVDGNSGFLGELNSIIEDYPVPSIPDYSVTLPTISFTNLTTPAPSVGSLDLNFPSFTAVLPALTNLPTIDLSTVVPPTAPADISAAISWTEESYDLTLYTPLLARLIADLQSGASGLDATIEQAIYDRASARQDIIDDAAERDALEFFSSRGFDLPPLAMAGRLQEMANERARNRTDLNEKILIEQAELAQKNSQFVIQVSKDFEAVLRDFSSKTNDRNLDYSKSVAANAIALYAENIKGYIAVVEANKAYIEMQVENLKAVVEYNKGLVSQFIAEAEAYNSVIEGKSKRNEAVTEIFKAEIAGFDSEVKAEESRQKTIVEQYRLLLENADIQLRAAIAEVDADIRGYVAESGLRERVSADMANIAMQSVASAYGSVNASAGIDYQMGRSQTESFGHTEQRSIGYDVTNTLHETHAFEDEAVTAP